MQLSTVTRAGAAVRRRAPCLALGFLLGACSWPGGSQETPPRPGLYLIAAAQGQVGSDAEPTRTSGYGSFLAGLFAGQAGDLSAAADFMLEALTLDPDNPQLLERAFILVASDGRQAKAVELARRLVEIQPENGLAALVLAVDSAKQGDPARAESLLSTMPERGLSDISGPLLRAWLRLAQDDMAGAESIISPLANRQGLAVFHGVHLAAMRDLAGDTKGAEVAYEAALADATQVSLRLAILAGNFFERQGKPERALEVYRTVLERSPESTVLEQAIARAESGESPEPEIADPQEGLAEILFNLASLLSQERAEEIALIHLHLALWLRPEFDIAQVLLGEILQEQGRGREAIAAYREVPETSPFAWTVRLRIAEELERLEDIEAAVKELEALAAARPERFEALYRLGNLYRTRERFEEAAEAYDRAEARLEEPDRRHWTLYYFRGIAFERLSEWERAEQDFLRALELEPEQPFVMNYLAYSWVEQQQNLDEAKSMLARAVELRPEDGYIVDSLGWVYYKLGEYQKGVRYLERAVELRPQDPVINDHLGDVYWRVGRYAEARFQWRRALSLDPEPEEVPKIEEKIERGLVEPPKDI